MTMKKFTSRTLIYLLKKYEFAFVFLGWFIVSAFIFSFIENRILAFFISGGGITLIVAFLNIRFHDKPENAQQELMAEVERMQASIHEQEKIVAESEGMNVTKPVNENAAKEIVARLISERRQQPPH